MPFTPEEIAEEEERRRRENGGSYPAKKKRAPEPTGLVQTPDGPRCPKCGGSQFKARRTLGQRLGIGAATVLSAPVSAGAGGVAAAKVAKQKVQCVTCGTFYERIQ